MVFRKRNQNKNLETSTIANLFQLKTSKDECFLLWDSNTENTEESRIILFATKSNLDLLQEFKNWSVDGTFNTAPESFSQIYTIHILVEKKAVPVVFALLENKQTSTYERVVLKLKDLRPSLQP